MISLFHCGYYVSPLNFSVSADRIVEYYEIELYTMHCGSAFINGERFEPKRNWILFAKPDDLRHSEGRYSCHSVKFACDDKDFIEAIESMCGARVVDKADELAVLFEHLYTASRMQKWLDVDATVRKIVATAYYHRTVSTVFSQYSDAVNNAVEFINADLSKSISLSDMASVANLSPSFFHKVFKLVVGQTPNNYVITKRIELAKELLIDNSLSVEQVAQRCGFMERAYFDKVFKQKTGTTPALFRKRINSTN